MSLLPRIGLPSVNAFIRPSRFIENQPSIQAGTILEKQIALARITTVFLVNTLIFSLPIAAGSSRYIAAILENMAAVSLSLVLLSGITYWTFHIGLVVTRNSDGLLHSYQSVVYSTGIYLALALGYLYTFLRPQLGDYEINPSPVGALFKLWVENLGYWVYQISNPLEGAHIFGVTLWIMQSAMAPGTPWNLATRTSSDLLPDSILVDFTLLEYTIVMIGVLLVLNYLYSFYLAARLRHGATRLEAVVVMGITAFAPALTIFWGLTSSGKWQFSILTPLLLYFVYKTSLTPPTQTLSQ